MEQRRNVLTPEDLSAITMAVRSNFGGMTEMEHMQQHTAIKAFIDRENKKMERMDKTWNTIMVTAVISTSGTICSGLGYLIWLGIKTQLGAQ